MTQTHMMLLTGIAALFLATGDTAAAKVDRGACFRQMSEMGFDSKQSKRFCNPNNYVKRPRLGWGCEQASGPLIKVPGGAKRKRDAICE
jgi:hypothetical protein